MRTGFFAYSGSPKSSGESIEEAIKQINSGGVTELRSWRNYTVSGKLIINDVTEAINNSDYFCADLTGMSDNVLFELGYAIARNKPIFLLLDTSHTDSFNKYRELAILTTFGYSKYTNTWNIVEAFFREKTFETSDGSLSNLMGKTKLSEDKQSLLLLKNQIDTNYNGLILNKIRNEYKLSYILDDASETPVRSLTWYLESLSNVPAVLAEFSSCDRKGYAIQNSKCSLVSGLAYGLGRELLMLALEPYEAPIDYREFFVKYDNRKRCEDAVSPFLSFLRDRAIEFLSKRTLNQRIQKDRTDLQNIDFGEYVAENEDDLLTNYYLEIFDLKTLAKNQYNIIIGRKGSGKTATLYSLKNRLEEDSRNHICLIKPVSFEIEVLLYLLDTLPKNYEKSYVVESAWKLLVYTEIAKSIYEDIQRRHPFSHTDSEKAFLTFIEQKSNLFLNDLSERLEKELASISIPSEEESISDFKVRVSEAIHETTLSRVRDMLGELFNREKRIVVLIDNLDKSWTKGSQIDSQSKWILGLLNVTEKIVRDLARVGNKQLGFNLTIFLRSDIFKYIQDNSTEPDKLGYINLRWNDPDILFRIIEKRFVELNQKSVLEKDLWDIYMTKLVDDEPVKEYIFNRILPRPRDLIFFFKQAQINAALKGHTAIKEDDLKAAYQEYSSWVFSAMLVENGITIEQMKSFLYQLVGLSNILDRETIYVCMVNAGITEDSEEYLDYFIDHLASLSIIGREVEKGSFSYEYDFDSKDRIKILAKRLGTNRFKIHNALVPYLSYKVSS